MKLRGGSNESIVWYATLSNTFCDFFLDMFFFSLFFRYCYMFMYPCECAVSIAVFVVMATGVSGVLIARVVLWSLEVQPSKVVKDVG